MPDYCLPRLLVRRGTGANASLGLVSLPTDFYLSKQLLFASPLFFLSLPLSFALFIQPLNIIALNSLLQLDLVLSIPHASQLIRNH